MKRKQKRVGNKLQEEKRKKKREEKRKKKREEKRKKKREEKRKKKKSKRKRCGEDTHFASPVRTEGSRGQMSAVTRMSVVGCSLTRRSATCATVARCVAWCLLAPSEPDSQSRRHNS